MSLRLPRTALSFALVFLLFSGITAHADFLNFSQGQAQLRPQKALQAQPELSREEREKRKRENAALAAQTGVDIPDTFDQELLSPSGSKPTSIEDINTMRAIKMSQKAQSSLDQKQTSHASPANNRPAPQTERPIYLAPKTQSNPSAKRPIYRFNKK